MAEEPMGHVLPQKLQHADCAPPPPTFYTEVCNM